MPDASYYLNSPAPQVQSSLGGQPAAKSSGGFSIFGYHPSLPNLGGITALKQLASGFIGLPESAYKIGTDVASGNLGDLNPLNPDTTTGKYLYGFGHGVEGVGASAAGVVGVPFTRYNLGDEVVAPLLQKVNEVLPTGTDPKTGNALPAFKPSTFWQRPGGPIAGLVQDLATVAVVAGPIAGTLGKAATAAEEASAAAAEAASAGTGTAEAAAEASARAAAVAHQAEIAGHFSHPYQYLGGKAAELSQAAWQAAHPAVSEVAAAAESPAAVLARQDAHGLDIAAVGAELRSLQATETAAAQAITAPERMTTLYRGADHPEALGAQGSWWSAEPPTGQGGYPHWQTTEVPTARIEELKAAAEEARVRGEGQPRPQDVYLDPSNPKNADLFNNAKQHEPGTEPGARQLKIDRTHLAEGETGNPQPRESVRPEGAVSDAESEIRAREAAAREQVPTSSVAEKTAARLAEPAPAWAQRITSALPDSVNRVLGALATPIARHQVLGVARDLARYVEVSQRQARTSDFVVQAEQAAQQLVTTAGVSRRDASIMIGEQISAINDATAYVDEFVKAGGNPELTQALHDTALRGYSGVTPEVRVALGTEGAAALDAQINQAVQAWRAESAKRFNTLLASPHGARGLEDAVLQTDEPHMSPAQTKAYRGAVQELRLETALRERIPQEMMKNEAAAQRATLLSDRASAEAADLRTKVGIYERTAETLHDSIPLAVRAENIDGAVTAITEAILSDKGVTYDVGRNLPSLPHEGFAVGIANQFDMPMEQFLAGGADGAIRDALTNPKNPDGGTYGPGVWAGPDARFGAWQHVGPDGKQWISGEISMSTWGGKPLAQWQATVLGEAYGQEAIWDHTAGVPVQLSRQRDVQNLMALYAGDALQPQSGFSRFATQLAKTDRQVPGISAADTDAALRLYATWDHALAQSNPEAWSHGDYFKAVNVSFGKADPRSTALLAQTVLGLSTKDGTEAALANMDAAAVSEALRWYYDSHDYVESMYRGKPVTLLDGTQRDGAEVFYDLLAVTSVMASPKQNLGRALMAMSNLNDFMGARKNALAAAKSLMKQLEETPAGAVESNGTKLSARFLTPEVRALTEQTSMVNAPKYNVFDVLSGRLNLANASDADVAALPEFWIGKGKSLGIGRGIRPIFEKDYAARGGVPERASNVSPEEFQQIAQEGKAIVAQRMKASTPNTLDHAALVDPLYAAVKESWGGDTIDTHTGVAVVKDESGGQQYSVTARGRGQSAVTLPETATKAQFSKALKQALVTFKTQLDSQGAHLGVFHDDSLHTIEIDPTYVVGSTKESDAIGAFSGATGGAYHYQSGDGYFAPYIKNDALMENSGSKLLAKLRSFRSNLSDPHNSLAVTLDSVMSRLYGFSSTDWSGGNTYGIHANEIRDMAETLTQRFGREVKPHEVQALLWVYAKQTIGRQDFGRLLAHHDMAQGALDALEKALAAGQHVDPRSFDPLGDYWHEELGYSKEALDARTERAYLTKQAKARNLTPEEQASLASLQARNLGEIRSNEVLTAHPREDVAALPEDSAQYGYETRNQIPYDAKKLAGKETQYGKYVNDTLLPMRKSIAAGDIEEARRLLTSYVVKQRRGIMGDVGGSFQTVGEETRGAPIDVAHVAEQRLRAGGPVPAPGQWSDYQRRGNLSELHQQFQGTLRGATITDLGKDGRLQMRMFQDAALDTLAHEGGHLLRQMLPADEMAQVLARYPHITDATLTGERVVSEEKFVSDMMMYIRQHSTQGDTGPLPDVFRRIAATLEEQHAAMLDHTFRRGLDPEVAAWWQRLFHPGLEHPDHIVDPIDIRRVTSLSGPETKQFPWESDAQFAQRARQYGEARARVETAQFKAQLMARAAAKADASARRMWAVFNNEPGKLEAMANQMHTHAMNVLDKLGRQLEDPTTGAVPQAFKPMWEAFQALHEQAKLDPRINDMLEEIPSTFSAALQSAAKRGFDPQYVPDLTWDRAQRLLFGHIQLGKGDQLATVSGMRKENLGVLNRAGLADRSIEALAAGTVDATHELFSNTLVQFVNDNWAKPFTPGAQIPDGWVPWDAARDYLLTGTDKRGEFIASNAHYIIPKAVDNALTSMTKRYDHWTFHTLTKVTKPWITYNLTLSPRWYLHIFVSNIIRGLSEGASLHDWTTAIRQWKEGTLPEEVYGHSIASLMSDGQHTLLGQTIADARKTDGMKAALSEVRHRVTKVHDVVDEVSRAAVFEHTLRTAGSRAQALTRSYEAMVDYGALTPFERQAVRSVVPFYPFYKGMVKLLARFPADHPAATAALLLAGKIHQEYLQDRLGGQLPDAYMGLANIGGLHNFTILDPFLNPLHLVDIHQVSSVLNPFVDIALRTAYNAAEPGTGQPGMTATGQKVSQVNIAAALGANFEGAPVNRLVGTTLGGGDVYHKNPGVAGGIGTFLGVPTTPDVAKIQATVQKTLGTLPKKGQPGYVAKPHKPRSSTRKVRQSFARIRGPRKPRKVRLPIIKR